MIRLSKAMVGALVIFVGPWVLVSDVQGKPIPDMPLWLAIVIAVLVAAISTVWWVFAGLARGR